MKLISMTDFVLEQSKLKTNSTDLFLDSVKCNDRIFKYANFLKQPLTLGMFVPCDEDGNVLNEKIHDYNKYQQAKERVLFDGIHFTNNSEFTSLPTIYIGDKVIHNQGAKGFWYSCIEDLIHFNLILTQSAIKQLI